jgi:predicted Fe-Mo cluster-binding NifX family protein
MKIAITSTGKTLESTTDPRFGHCAYFVVFDSKSKTTEFIPNQLRRWRKVLGLQQ